MYSDSQLRQVIIFLHISGMRIEAMHTTTSEVVPERNPSQEGMASEEGSHLKHNHHLVTTSVARFHVNHINL